MEESMYKELQEMKRDIFALQEYCENLEDRLEVLEDATTDEDDDEEEEE